MLTAPSRLLSLSLERLVERDDDETITEVFGDVETFADHLEQLRYLRLHEVAL